MKPKPQITAAQAAELEQRTLANIIERIGAGAVPTVREIGMLRAATAEPPAPEIKLRSASNSELARHYSVSLSTVKSWLRKYGSATVRDPARLQHALDSQRSGKEIDTGTPLAAARLRKVGLEADRLKFELEASRGEWCRNADVVSMVTFWAGTYRAELEALAHQHAPLWGGLTPPQIEAAAVQWVHGVMARLTEISDRRIAAMSKPSK